MIIQSNFKDYYDYVEHINGGDPKNVYVRHRLKPLANYNGIHIDETIRIPFNIDRRLPYSYSSEFRYCNFKWCIVCGKYYLIVQETPPNKPIKPWTVVTLESEIMQRLFPDKKKSKRFLAREITPEMFFGDSDSAAIELCRKLNHPVFIMENGYGYISDQDRYFHRKRFPIVDVNCELPILQELGFASIIPAPIMYQDIAYFLSSTIRTNPDNAPPVEVSNSDRIVGHGFDLTESFRHRK